VSSTLLCSILQVYNGLGSKISLHSFSNELYLSNSFNKICFRSLHRNAISLCRVDNEDSNSLFELVFAFRILVCSLIYHIVQLHGKDNVISDAMHEGCFTTRTHVGFKHDVHTLVFTYEVHTRICTLNHCNCTCAALDLGAIFHVRL